MPHSSGVAFPRDLFLRSASPREGYRREGTERAAKPPAAAAEQRRQAADGRGRSEHAQDQAR